MAILCIIGEILGGPQHSSMNTSSLSSIGNRERVRTALQATYGLTLFHNVLNDKPAQAVLHLLSMLSSQTTDITQIASSYSQAFRELAMLMHEEHIPSLADAWQAYLIARIVDDDNIVSQQVERAGAASVNSSVYLQAQHDLRILELLFRLDADLVLQMTTDAVVPTLPMLQNTWLPWRNIAPPPVETRNTARNMLAHRASVSDNWEGLLEPLIAHWARHGTGLFAHYRVLRWQGVHEGLQGIAYPDPVRLTDLIGYKREQNMLKANTERFLISLPAHDVLLYGAPGTGKSSTVKALVNMYAEQGLRLVEVRKEYISDLPRVVARLRGHAPRFLLFIDDLSFEEHETEYKVLKMLLEGTVEARPSNVLIYATTNRQNLIRENFSDRGKPVDDVNWRDTMDEKLSLVHRFGLRVTFTTPDQEHYLDIALGLARQRGIPMGEETLRARALQWERQHVGRSGRLARQFIDDLQAELQQKE